MSWVRSQVACVEHSCVQDQEADDTDIQARLLADVASVRQRHRRTFVQEQLQQDVLKEHVVVVNFGELALLDTLAFCHTGAEPRTFRIQVRCQVSLLDVSRR